MGTGLRDRGFPVALVLQDGMDASEVPWPQLDAVFVGGSTEFKMCDEAGAVVCEANRRGLWAHMGRVNGRRRLNYAASIGCDSIDGTQFSRWRDRWLDEGLSWMAGGRQLALEP